MRHSPAHSPTHSPTRPALAAHTTHSPVELPVPPVHHTRKKTPKYSVASPALRASLPGALIDDVTFPARADGSLDLWIQAAAPAADRQSNWLPVRAAAPFLLNARLYWPDEAAVNGSWGMPAVERLD